MTQAELMNPINLTILAALGVALIPGTAVAQVPGTDIYVMPLNERASGVGNPRNVTHRIGYDNQPYFTPDGAALMYTSVREDDQADIWRVSLEGAAPRRLTETLESEYSATPTPDGRRFVTVRVEADSTQRLWSFGRNGGDTAELLVPELAPVGYFAFVRPDEVVAFVLGSPPTLQATATGSGQAARVVAINVGRSIHAIPGATGQASFVQKGEEGWWITGVRLGMNGQPDSLWRIAPTLPSTEDYVWAGSDVLLMARGSELFRWRVGRDEEWTVIADLARFGIEGITRLAVSPDGRTLALVARDGEVH